MNSQEFRELTHEVPVFIDVNPMFVSVKVITPQRAKRAANILIENGYDANLNKLDKRYIKINHK